MDALTYSGFKALAALYHLELAAIPCRPEGPDLQALQTLCQQRRVRAVYTMPTLHNPLGWVCSTPGSGRRWPILRASTIC